MKIVTCPGCGNEATYSEKNPFRPFCSERCKLIDLGDWADERFRIPEKVTQQNVNENEEDDDETALPK